MLWLVAVSVGASALGGMLGMASGIFIVPIRLCYRGDLSLMVELRNRLFLSPILNRADLRCARNATIFRHFLAHLPNILAQELRDLTREERRRTKKELLMISRQFM
jgi:hypothetical protein